MSIVEPFYPLYLKPELVYLFSSDGLHRNIKITLGLLVCQVKPNEYANTPTDTEPAGTVTTGPATGAVACNAEGTDGVPE
jgi:hypothetical protein